MLENDLKSNEVIKSNIEIDRLNNTLKKYLIFKI